MFHWFSIVQNSRGDALPGWQVECVQLADGQTVVPIFADENSTPIASVSGVTNRAVADENGNYSFFVPSGTYSLRFYNSAGVFQGRQRFVAMFGTDFTTGLISDLASYETDKGSSLVGNIASGAGATGRTVQSKLREFSSIRDYGAVGDGVADDRAAALAANAASRVTLLTEGSYKFSDTIFSAPDTTWFALGAEVPGPGRFDADGDGSILDQRQSDFVVLRAMSRDTNEQTVYIGASMLPADAGVAVPGQPPGYQKNALYVAMINYDSNAVGEAKNATGISVLSQQAPGVTGGQIWGYHTQVYIHSGADAYACAVEGEIFNNGAAQTEVNEPNSKLGVHIVAKGPQHSTAGILFNSWSGLNGAGDDYTAFTDGIVVGEHAVARYAFAVRRFVGLTAGNHVDLFTVGVDGTLRMTAPTVLPSLTVNGTATFGRRGNSGFAVAVRGSDGTTRNGVIQLGVDVADFGAVGDGTTDDTAAIQAALDSGAKRITARAGLNFRITAALSINADFVNLDLNRSELKMDDATGLLSHLVLGDGTTRRNAIKIENVVFTRAQAATGGYAIDTDLVGVLTIENCRIFGDNKIWRGIRLRRAIVTQLLTNYIDNCVNRGLFMEGTGTAADATIDVTASGNRIEGGVSAFEATDFVEGLFFRNNIFFNTSGTGAVIDATTNANGLFSMKFQQNDFDTCAGGGFYIDKVNNIQVTDCWFSNNGGDDLRLGTLTDGAIVQGNQFYPAGRAVLVQGNAANITGNLVSGGTICVQIEPTANYTDVTGNSFSNAQRAVKLTTAVNSYVSGNSIYGMSAATIDDAGGAACYVHGNKGDNNASVASSITVGASPYTYTAGIRPESVSVFGGTVSEITVGGVTVANASPFSIVLNPGQSMVVTHSAAPTMTRNVL